ncbi:hypothetical protein [Prosthecobacter sp.]|uniref:hypothetical protein n=1 Tax=Prosthecobacter sp. TaxID=1965333 RepID=UPI0037840B36
MKTAKTKNLNNPSDPKAIGPSFDQAVKIYLANGQTIEFVADWNFGLGEFVMDYEAFMSSGTPQKQSRYQMQDTTQKKNNHINLKFASIVALYLAKK